MATVRERYQTMSHNNEVGILKTELQAVIVDTSAEMLASLLDILAEMDFEITSAPAQGLLMMNIRASDETVFHLGEVLVTEAQVKMNGQNGYGCCMGDCADAALALACLDALSRCQTAAAPLDRINQAVKDICCQVSAQRSTQSRLAATTQVDFHSMAEE
jgi:alpha-D-ribose 1-methylphosphonate 5-triphosphate synthase subunit PhnG